MNFALSGEQVMIRESAEQVLAERSASAQVRHAIEHLAGRDEALWCALAGELGWCALAVPEAAGGAGLGALEQILLMEQMGRRLVCVPYFATACLAATALAKCESGMAQAALARIAAGELSATLALPLDGDLDAARFPVSAQKTADGYRLSGSLDEVLDGACAELLLVPARLADEGGKAALFALDTTACDGLVRTAIETLDATRPLARIELPGVHVPQAALLAGSGAAGRVLAHTAWFAALALAAEELGGAQQCLDLTLGYTNQRVQFGRPIASFQAVKHRCAQMLVQIEAARSAVLGAARAWDSEAVERSLSAGLRADVAAAKAVANDAFLFCAQEAIQLHGGVGFTWEYDPQLFFKRAQASASHFGNTSLWLSRVAKYVMDGVAPHCAGGSN